MDVTLNNFQLNFYEKNRFSLPIQNLFQFVPILHDIRAEDLHSAAMNGECLRFLHTFIKRAKYFCFHVIQHLTNCTS